MPITEKEDRDAIDNLTNTMLSVGFLHSISDFIFSPKRNNLSVGQFYDERAKKIKKLHIPFTLGIILGEMYVAIVYGKENWFDDIPAR